MSHIFGNGSAAALVNRAKLAGLPVHTFRFHDTDDLRHGLRAGIVRCGLAPGTGIFGQHTTLVDVTGVIRLKYICKGRIVSRVYIGRQAQGMLTQILCICSLHLGQAFQIVL